MSENKVYMGNLSYDTTEDSLRSAVEANEVSVKSVNVITDKMTGRPRGFAFVELETSDDMQKVIDAMDGKDIDGREVKVNEAKERKPRRDNFGGGGGSGYGGGRDRY